MDNTSYWAKRYEQLMTREMKKAEKVDEELQRAYLKSARRLEDKLANWYQRYMDGNDVSLAEAQRILHTKELEEFKWDVSTYIANGSAGNLTDEMKRMLENASIKYHVSRLEALQAQIIMLINDLYTEEHGRVEVLASDVYQSAFYRSLYEKERVRKTLNTFNRLPVSEIKRMLERPYLSDGLNFSDRIWKNRDTLIKEVNSVLIQGLINGRNSDREARELAKAIGGQLATNDTIEDVKRKMANARRASKRLILTEASFFANQAVADSCEELGAERYQLIATLDTHTSSICQTMDLQTFKLEDKAVGVNYPPFHPYCRTVATPYDEFQDEQDTRIGRDKDGNKILIPHDMTYKEWYNEYITEPQRNREERTDQEERAERAEREEREEPREERTERERAERLRQEKGQQFQSIEVDADDNVILKGRWGQISPENYDRVRMQGHTLLNKLEDDTEEYTEAVKKYTGNGYFEDINAILRNKDVPKGRREELLPTIETLETLLRLSPTSADVITYRGQSYKYLKNWEIGETYEIDSFWSSSFNPARAVQFGQGSEDEPDGAVLITILLPKGSEGLCIASKSAFPHEDELLLNNKMKLRLLHRRKKDDWTYLIAEGVGEDDVLERDERSDGA